MNTMLQTLAADGPFPEYADQLMTFGRFVGDWDFDVTVARERDGEIVLEGTGDDGETVYWIFSEIEDDSFHWRAEVDGRLMQEMDVRRRR
jgi:hypothetical protein